MNRSTLVAVAVAGLFVSAAATPAAAQSDDTQPALVVDLNEDGAAQVTVQLTYDLETESERAAFRELRTNETIRTTVVSRFRDRMARVADAMAADTGRDVSVANPRIDLSTTDDGRTGIVELSIEWDGFAARTDDRVTVSNPFATEYDPERRVVIVGPSGYEPTTVQPSATSTDGRTLVWSADADLDGFEVTFADTDAAGTGAEGTPSTDESTDARAEGTSGQGAGFGALVALVALLVAGALARRRRR